MGWIVLYRGEDQALVLPVNKIARRVTGHANHVDALTGSGRNGSILTKPVIGTPLVEHTATMGLDGISFRIVPDFAWPEHVKPPSKEKAMLDHGSAAAIQHSSIVRSRLA